MLFFFFPQSTECWVLHSTTEYAQHVIARTGLQKSSSEILTKVAEELFQEFQSTKLSIPQAFFKKVHKWSRSCTQSDSVPVLVGRGPEKKSMRWILNLPHVLSKKVTSEDNDFFSILTVALYLQKVSLRNRNRSPT